VSGLLAASSETRPVFWDFTTPLKVLWYVLAVLSVLVFLYGVARPIAKYRHGRGGSLPPARELWPRLFRGLRTLFAHRTIARRDRTAGLAHALIFYGFLTLFAGTVILGFQTDFTEPVFGWTYFHGTFYLVYKEVLNLLGTALILGLLVMMVRRATHPRKLDYARPDREPGEPQFDRGVYRVGDWAFVGILLVIAITGFLLEGVRIAMDQPGYGGTQFGGWVAAQIFTGIGFSNAALGGIRHGLWWFHGLLAIAFVASIPYTKAVHMFASYFSLSLRDPLAGKRLAPVAPERANAPLGYGALADFSELHLIQLDACTKCGRCHEACPAFATGRPLSPRDVILELREEANRAAAETGIGGVLGTLLHAPRGRPDATAGDAQAGGFNASVIGPEGVRSETAWACMQCNACVEICPVGIEQAPIINQLRRRLVEDGDIDPTLQATLQTIHKSGNSFGENRRRRGRWTEQLEFAVKDARQERVDVLWFVGDYASFDPRSQRVSCSLARIFRAAGVDFGILYDGERNAGNDVRRVGEEGLFESLAEHNIDVLSGCDFERIVTSDPHSLNTLRNEYPDLGGSWSVSHHTAFVLELIDGGRLALAQRLPYRVTYHDPCYLGRHNGGYDAPRQILERLGCTLVEMPRNRDNSFCCGAGGGRIWIPDTPGQERPSENRIREAVALPEIELFVVACPKDVTMYEDAIKTSGNADRIELRELTELVEEALLPAAALVGVE
jgi:Fe-S oxidoreductase